MDLIVYAMIYYYTVKSSKETGINKNLIMHN